MLLCLGGGLIVVLAVAEAWARHCRRGVVSCVEVKRDTGKAAAWRWFALDTRRIIRGSCNPRRFVTPAMAADDARFVFPGVRVLIRRGHE